MEDVKDKVMGRRIMDPEGRKRLQIGVTLHPDVVQFLRSVGNISAYIEQAIRERHRRDRVKDAPSKPT
jgi:hypothetical protein